MERSIVVIVLVLICNIKWIKMDDSYRFNVSIVDSCPSTLQSRDVAAARLKCSMDRNNNPTYFCVPNQKKTNLLEFCYDEFLGLVQKGYCLHLSTSGYLNQEECSSFVEGCPDKPFLSYNIYTYPKCQEIEIRNRCFLADPNCTESSSSVISTTPSERSTPNLSLVSYNMLRSSTSSQSPPNLNDEHNIPEGLVVVIVVVMVAAIIVPVLIFLFLKRRRRSGGNEMESCAEERGILLQDSEGSISSTQSKAHWPHQHKQHSEVEVKEEGDNLHIRICTNHPPDDDTVKWQKDGENIPSDSEKYMYISQGQRLKDRHIYLYVYNTTNKDSGVYNAIWKVEGVEYKKDVLWQKHDRKTGHRNRDSGRKREVTEVLMRQYGNDMRIRVTTNNPPLDVQWTKDGKKIYCSENPKYLTLVGTKEDEKHFFLYIFDSGLEDSGSYKASWTEKKDESTIKCECSEARIHLEVLTLFGPNIKVEKDKTTSQKVDKLKNIIFPIFPKDRTYHLVITESKASTKNCTLGTFSNFEDDDIRRLLLFGVLLSEGQKITWSNEENMKLLHDIKKLMKNKQPISINDYKDAAHELSDSSLLVDEEGIAFINEDMEMQTMWALMQNHNTKETIKWLFEQQKRAIVQKYLRTPHYKRHIDEPCVVLPDMLCENFREFLILQYIKESGGGQLREEHINELFEMKKEGYVFRQKQSTILQCVVYYTFYAGDNAPGCLEKYIRSSGYEAQENEMCICIPVEYNEDLIRKLDIDILTHKTISDTSIHAEISSRLHVPEEVLLWNIDQRQRFVKNFKIGNIEMYRARGMIVGCAGAGKTTLLIRLQRRDGKNLQKNTKTTLGLEVHDNIFVIDSDTLEDYVTDDDQPQNGKENPPVDLHVDRKLLSMTDFAGQVAYYACHQIYLSRRAFYLLVVDMSKSLKDVAYQKDRNDPMGSLFENWTYENYFVFWLRSIKTYCDDEKMEERYSDKARANPVIIIASHHDRLKVRLNATKFPLSPCCFLQETCEIEPGKTFYDELENCLPKEHTLKAHISNERYFEIECPKGNLREDQEEAIEKVRKCIVQTAKSLPHWGEKIPVQWSVFEHFARTNKNKKIVEMVELQKMEEFHLMDDNDMDDMLSFYQEIGQIIYFSDEILRENIIMDVQWFVDAFKNIITDPTHVRSFCKKVKEWDVFMKTGRISDSTLHDIWSENNNTLYISHRDKIMPYMEKLGILAKVRTQTVGREEHENVQFEEQRESLYYIPSINKTDITEKCRAVIRKGNKTPILVFSFKTYLPHFFFYRLVVTCFTMWDSLSDDLFCKNLAFYKDKGGNRNIAIGVNKTSIHLQVFSPGVDIELTADKTREIRKHVETMINQLATTFHQKVLCETGYVCKSLEITEEDENYFLSEKTVKELETNIRVCPRYYATNHEEHNIVRDDLLHYWYQADAATDL